MLVLAGIFAYFTLSAYLAHCGLMTVIFLGITLRCLIRTAENAKIFKSPSLKAGTPLQDGNLDRVRFVRVSFKDWRKNERFTLNWEVTPDRRPVHYEFFIDSRIMVDNMLEKESVVLLDECGRSIPIQNYMYTWEELEYKDSGGDGCATLKVYPRVAAA